MAILPVQHDLEQGVVLEAELTLESSSGPLGGIGLFVGWDAARSGLHSGVPGTLLLAQNDGRFVVGPYNGYGFKPEDAKPLLFSFGQATRWRLLLRDAYLELYVDDELVQCYTLARSLSGRLGFVVEAGSATVDNVRVWTMSL